MIFLSQGSTYIIAAGLNCKEEGSLPAFAFSATHITPTANIAAKIAFLK
jgi:hypothetical protein